MRPDDKPPYLSMNPRVFVRALRDPNQSAGEEYELTEGEATDLLILREQAAYMKGLRAAAHLLRHEVDAIEIAMKKDANERGYRLSTADVAREPADKGSEGL